MKFKEHIAEKKLMFKKYRPDKNDVDIDESTNVKWKIKPKIDLKKRKVKELDISLKLKKEIEDEDVTIELKAGGDVISIINNKFDESGFKAEFKATKKF